MLLNIDMLLTISLSLCIRVKFKIVHVMSENGEHDDVCMIAVVLGGGGSFKESETCFIDETIIATLALKYKYNVYMRTIRWHSRSFHNSRHVDGFCKVFCIDPNHTSD